MRNHATHAGSSLAQSVCEGRQKPNAAHPQLWQLSHALQIRQLLRSSNILLTVCSRFSHAFATFTRVSAQSRSPGKSVSASSATHTLPGAEHTPTLQVGRRTQEVAQTAAQRVRRNRAIHPAMPKASNGFVRVSSSGRLVWRVGSVGRSFGGRVPDGWPMDRLFGRWRRACMVKDGKCAQRYSTKT